MGAAVENKGNEYLGPRALINRSEYIRLLEQALCQLGYPSLAHRLEEESGIEMQPQAATAFRQAILAGDYEGALALLPSLGPTPDSVDRARFLLLSHKYKEAVATGNLGAALHCLRHELQPSSTASGHSQSATAESLHALAAMLVAPSVGEAHPAPLTPGKEREHRETLLADLQALLPPSILVPESRLEELVEQALLAQLDKCPYHNSRLLHLSLFVDYVAGPEQLPTHLAQALDAHTDEVWVVQFSMDGKWMVTASKDGKALLWAVSPEDGKLSLSRALLHGQAPINIANFSPDSTYVVIGAGDGRIRVLNVASGALELEVRVESASTAAWLPDSRHLLVAAGNRELQVMDVSAGGAVVDRIPLGQHTYDAVVARDGSACVIVGQDRRLRYLRLSDRREVLLGPEPAAVTCLSLSPDGRFIAANMANGVVHLWPLGELALPAQTGNVRPGSTDPLDALPATPLQEFRTSNSGQPGRFVIRSAFGGTGCAFLASGNEEGAVHLWHRESGELLTTLEGHTRSVNAVAWNPRDQYMLASASDDHTVKIWRAPAAAGRSLPT